MRRLSKKAFATLGACEETNNYFGITVDEDHPRLYRFVWSFKIDKDKAKREGYDTKKVTGSVVLDDNYPGCPYCGDKEFVVCQCGGIICWHGQPMLTCPHCGYTGLVHKVEAVDIKGGGF